MKYASVTGRLASLGGDKWEIYALARQMNATGADIVELTIGEPDIPTPKFLLDAAIESLNKGRTLYSSGRGEQNLLDALAARYTQRMLRPINANQILCFPGTQTSLYSVMCGLVEAGDEVLIGDPLYATYEGVIASTGATFVPVPLRPEYDFRMNAADVESRITDKTRVIMLNTPHNPTGAVLNAEDVQAIGELAIKHDLWVVSDEVYDEMVFSTSTFVSPLQFEKFAERVVIVSSISKSHAAPGFRSGWCVGPEEFCAKVLPLSETMLFGNQPFIADMTALAVSAPSEAAAGMMIRFERRARLLEQRLHDESELNVQLPEAGMFALVDVSATGMSGYDYAIHLLHNGGVAVMPGSSFGSSLHNWVRIALTTDDVPFADACTRMIAHSQQLKTSS